jgi:PTH2 family peptidyl-tRNA hydrolase
MSVGKSAAQACHAARLSLLHYLARHPERADEFIKANSVGTIVVLEAPDLPAIETLAAKAEAHALPWALFVDSGHICPPSFDGSSIPTAVAIGPALQAQINPLTRKFKSLKRNLSSSRET